MIIPPGWTIARLDQVADWSSGGTPKAGRRAYYGGDIPWAVIGDLADGAVRATANSITQLGLENSSAKIVPAGSVLVAMYGSIGKLGVAGLPMATNQAIAIAQPREGISREFLFYYLMSQRDLLNAAGRGGTQRNISQSILKPWPIPLPPPDEQCRVVEIIEDHLSRLDAANRALITSTARARALIRATLMRAIPDVTEYPSHWLASTVDHAGSVTLGRQRHPDWHTGDNMQPYLRVANVFEDRIDTSDVMQMHWPEGTFERFRLVPGDILLNEGQTPELLGRPAMYRGEPGEVAFTNSLLRFQANALVNPEFALIVFRRHMHAGRFTRESRITTNIAHLSATRLKPIEFPIAPLDEQERIVLEVRKHLGAVGRLQEGMADASLRSRALRRAVLAAAFSGRLTGAASDGDLIEETAETLEGER